jgi:hypothetical protein
MHYIVFGGILEGAIIGAVAGAVAGLAVGVVKLLNPRRQCPDCGAGLPAMRRPADTRQALSGGCTCPACGCEVDARGRKVAWGKGGE